MPSACACSHRNADGQGSVKGPAAGADASVRAQVRAVIKALADNEQFVDIVAAEMRRSGLLL